MAEIVNLSGARKPSKTMESFAAECELAAAHMAQTTCDILAGAILAGLNPQEVSRMFDTKMSEVTKHVDDYARRSGLDAKVAAFLKGPFRAAPFNAEQRRDR